MRLPILLVFLVLAACSRPLTEGEKRFAADLFGESLDTSEIVVAHGLGVAPLYETVPGSVRVLRGTDEACVRTPQPFTVRQAPQAFAYRNRVHFGTPLYSSDMARPWPRALRFPQALILAHELTHVWQWQNRELTGYTPFRAAAESWVNSDPYYSGNMDVPLFLSFGYEQQAALVEDYVCFVVANPTHPRRAMLREVLAPVFPVDRFDAAIER